MKEIIKFSLFILFFAVVLVSCSKEKNQEPLQDLQNKSMTYLANLAMNFDFYP